MLIINCRIICLLLRQRQFLLTALHLTVIVTPLPCFSFNASISSFVPSLSPFSNWGNTWYSAGICCQRKAANNLICYLLLSSRWNSAKPLSTMQFSALCCKWLLTAVYKIKSCADTWIFGRRSGFTYLWCRIYVVILSACEFFPAFFLFRFAVNFLKQDLCQMWI